MGFSAYAVYSKCYTCSTRKTTFELKKGLMYRTAIGSVYTVPRGFKTDLGSIPAIFWPFIPRDDYPSAFILHDYLCESDWISRLDGDKILKEALLDSGCGKVKAWVIYSAVRAYATVMLIK